MADWAIRLDTRFPDDFEFGLVNERVMPRSDNHTNAVELTPMRREGRPEIILSNGFPDFLPL